ncbi:MAG TPA: cell surface protein SprA, partial [Saprospiraceae bacterium]|nr:cell surface protein SprA [Saprospiraceae bacterium]
KRQVALRFGTLELGRNQWRRYQRPIKDNGPGFPDLNYPPTAFDVNDVNIQENSGRIPFNYILPLGVSRERNVGGFQPNQLQNEQSLSLTVRDLHDGFSKAIYKLTNLDMRVFAKMKMFVHAERKNTDMDLKDGELSIFMRVGSDFEKNYYEYEIPLKLSDSTLVVSKPVSTSEVQEYSNEVWKKENEFNFPLEWFRQIKLIRNDEKANLNVVYEYQGNDPEVQLPPNHNLKIIGNPDLGFVRGVMIGIRNARNDGRPHSVEVWVNELRLTGLDERGGVAGIVRADFKAADFGQFTVASNYSSIGFGGLDQKLAQRSQEEIVQYDLTANLELGKFFSQDFGLRLPFLAQYSINTRTPRFDPILRDIELDDVLERVDENPDLSNSERETVRDSILDLAVTSTEIKSLNFTNVRKERTKGTASKPMPWNVENFTASYAYSETEKKTPFIESDNLSTHYGTLDYQYSISPVYIQPLKKLFKNDKYVKFISEFNFNPVPNNFTFGTAMDRKIQRTKYRFAGDDPQFNTFFNKQFLWDRDYNLNWDLAKSLKLNFNATNRAVIDELEEFDPETGIRRSRQEKKDFILEGIRDFGRTKNYQHNLSLSYTA